MEKINYIKSIHQCTQKSIEWLNQRKNKLTSSDLATALGINPYEKPESLLFKKCGHGPAFTGNVATKHGETYETEAINLYCKLMNKTNFEFGLICYSDINPIRKNKEDTLPEYNFLAGSPDGIAIDNENAEDLILLEVKCPMRRKIKFGYVPEYYMPQIQMNLAIFDIEKADFIEYIPAHIEPWKYELPMINIVRVHRDHKWFKNSVPILINFWNSVKHWRENDITKHHMFKPAKVDSKEIINNFRNDSDSDSEEIMVTSFREED